MTGSIWGWRTPNPSRVPGCSRLWGRYWISRNRSRPSSQVGMRSCDSPSRGHPASCRCAGGQGLSHRGATGTLRQQVAAWRDTQALIQAVSNRLVHFDQPRDHGSDPQVPSVERSAVRGAGQAGQHRSQGRHNSLLGVMRIVSVPLAAGRASGGPVTRGRHNVTWWMGAVRICSCPAAAAPSSTRMTEPICGRTSVKATTTSTSRLRPSPALSACPSIWCPARGQRSVASARNTLGWS